MSTSDPIADLCTRIRNGQAVGLGEISVSASKIKSSILNVLAEEGYIDGFAVEGLGGGAKLKVSLKYFNGRPVISRLSRVSKPGKRVYKGKNELPSVMGGYGVAIISTSLGVMSDKKARQAGHGGEILCLVE